MATVSFFEPSMNEPVQEWANANVPAENLLWKDGYWEQIMFVRDKIASLLCEKVDHTFEEYRDFVYVCSTHSSKSVTLPVFSIKWKRGIEFTIRYNFYDWGISVKANRPVVWEFDGLFAKDKTETCHEGFPTDRVYGTFEENPSQFTVGITDRYQLYAFMYLLKKQWKLVTELVVP